MKEVKEYYRRLGPAGPLAIVAASLPAFGGFALLGIMPWLSEWLKTQEYWGLVFYVTGFALLAGLALLPTYAQAIVGGFVFGRLLGAPAAICGYMGASIIGYVIARYASGDRIVHIIDEKPKWKKVYDALIRSGWLRALAIVTLLRVPPNSPFAITNLVMAGTQVRPWIYVVGTLIGLAPRTVVAVHIGAGLKELDFSDMRRTFMLVALVITAIFVLGMLGSLANKILARLTTSSAGPNDEDHANQAQ